MRQFFIGFSLFLLVAVSVVAWRASCSTRGEHATVERAHVEPAPPTTTPSAELDAPREVVSAREEPAPTATTATSPAPAAQEQQKIRIAGHVVVLDASGREHATEDGALTLVLWTHGRGTGSRVDVRAGRFEFEVKSETEWSFESGRLGGRAVAARKESQGRAELDVSRRLELHLRWPPASVVVARDARSNAHLSNVEVVALPENTFTVPRIPDTRRTANVVRKQGDSPLAIEMTEFADLPFVRVLHARAPGYAWSVAAFDPTVGGEVFFELEPGGDLDVSVAGGDLTARVMIRVRGAHRDAPLVDRAVGSARQLTLEGLPVGRHTLSAEIGEWFLTPEVLARTDVEVVAGGRVAATLALAEPTTKETFEVTGTLVVPRAWEPVKVSLAMQQLDQHYYATDSRPAVTCQPSEPDEHNLHYTWNAKAASAGRHRVHAPFAQFGVVVDVPHGGLRDVRIVVPEPADVEVRVIDAETRADVAPRSVQWNCRAPGSQSAVGSASVIQDPATRRYAFRAPVGDVTLSCLALDLGYARAYEIVPIRPGRNAVTLELTRACGVTLTLLDGERVVSIVRASDVALEPIEGEGQVNWSMSGGDMVCFFVTEPGRYRMTFSRALPGFEPPAPRVVEIPRATVVPITISLTRKP